MRTLAERTRNAVREGRAALQWFIEREEHDEAAAMRPLLADTLEAVREVNAAESAETALMWTTGEQTDWAEEGLRAASERLRAAEVSLESCVEVLEYRTQTRFGCSDEVTT